MNFFAHAVVARWSRDDHPFVLGAMLPDLSAMMGLRITGAAAAAAPGLQAGIDCHFATDAAFHASKHFVRLCGETVDQLTSEGVERGTARAVGHVGFELLLDGLLSRDAALLDAYTSTLAHAVENQLADRLSWEPAARQRMHGGLVRLLSAPVPTGYREPAFVVDRLQYILAPRPRLAIRPSDLASVSARVAQLHGEVEAIQAELLDDVRTRLASPTPS